MWFTPFCIRIWHGNSSKSGTLCVTRIYTLLSALRWNFLNRFDFLKSSRGFLLPIRKLDLQFGPKWSCSSRSLFRCVQDHLKRLQRLSGQIDFRKTGWLNRPRNNFPLNTRSILNFCKKLELKSLSYQRALIFWSQRSLSEKGIITFSLSNTLLLQWCMTMHVLWHTWLFLKLVSNFKLL